MEVILLERVAKLGQMGEVVTVKDGYARNYLLPQKKALRVNRQSPDLRSAEGPARGAQPRDQEGSRSPCRPSGRSALRHHPLCLRRRCALRVGHAP
jgi:hypothetical protein